ncbi:MAG: glycosyl hydrolase family 18 protein [Eubacterium sp.]
MKKKIILSVFAVILCLALLITSTVLAGNGYSDLDAPQGTENIVSSQLQSIVNSKGKNASKAVDGDTDTAWKSSGKTDYLELTFKEEQTFNTIILREKGMNIKSFTLSYYVNTPGNEHWESFYRQDTVQDYRFCAFEPVTTQKIKLEITDSDNLFKIREIEIYNVESKKINDFRVSDYVYMSNLTSGAIFDKSSENSYSPEYCDVINQIHIIPAAYWNNEGEIVVSEGKTVQELSQYVGQIRDFYGDKEVEIFATIFFNDCDPDVVLSQCADEVIENTVEFLLECDLDGVSYDWEYPTQKQWPVFSEHLINLKKALSPHGLKLSCAFSAWTCSISDDAIKALDQIELMCYDNFDNDGNHSSFTSGAVQPVEYFLEKGFKPEQINLGVPFYARPNDGGYIWIDYDDPNYTHYDKFQNASDNMWFNSAQMITDKTAYAIEKELGGMMIFCSVLDVPYDSEQSLLNAMKTTIDTRAIIEKGENAK